MFAIAKRVFLFLLLNLLIVTTISVLCSVLGITPYLSMRGIDYSQLFIYCLVWGMAGSFISLMLSRIMAKMMMGVKLIDPRTADGEARWLYETVSNLARAAKLPSTPEVGIYNSPEVNAFATGPTKSRALVAVSAGLLQRMNKDQIEGILGHEIAHVANGDMVTMTLLQGIVNTFVMFLARVAAFFLSQNVKEENRRMVYFLTHIVLEIVLNLLGWMVVAHFSRWREYRADHGGAVLAGRDKMLSALVGLRRNVEMVDNSQAALATFKINGKTGGFLALLSTHPPLEDRIARLETMTSV